jgi:hypothetical protein
MPGSLLALCFRGDNKAEFVFVCALAPPTKTRFMRSPRAQIRLHAAHGIKGTARHRRWPLIVLSCSNLYIRRTFHHARHCRRLPHHLKGLFRRKHRLASPCLRKLGPPFVPGAASHACSFTRPPQGGHRQASIPASPCVPTHESSSPAATRSGATASSSAVPPKTTTRESSRLDVSCVSPTACSS